MELSYGTFAEYGKFPRMPHSHLPALRYDDTRFADPITHNPAVQQTPAPPCEANGRCPNFNQCQVIGTVCEAFVGYVRRGWWAPGDVGTTPELVVNRRL